MKSQTRTAPAPIAFEADAETIRKETVVYAQRCLPCHGVAAMAGGVVADLRYSAPSVFENFHEIVVGGSQVSLGMPSFKVWMTEEEVDAVRAFVLSQRGKLTQAK